MNTYVNFKFLTLLLVTAATVHAMDPDKVLAGRSLPADVIKKYIEDKLRKTMSISAAEKTEALNVVIPFLAEIVGLNRWKSLREADLNESATDAYDYTSRAYQAYSKGLKAFETKINDAIKKELSKSKYADEDAFDKEYEKQLDKKTAYISSLNAVIDDLIREGKSIELKKKASEFLLNQANALQITLPDIVKQKLKDTAEKL